MFLYFLLFLGVCSVIELKVNAENSTVQRRTNSSAESVNRILEGELSFESDYRYMVAIMHTKEDYPVLICGGAIIHRRYVLTAAHCVHNYRNYQLTVRHGGFCAGPLGCLTPQDGTQTFHPVVKIFVPKVYSSLPCRKHHHDIGILKVGQVFDLSDFNRYAKVNLPEYDADYAGYIATVTGYGPDYVPLKELQGQKRYLQHVVQLRSMKATVMANDQCQYVADVVMTEGSLCAQPLNPASQTCFEDDGGPLVHQGTIIGILNDRRCNFNVPELFTRVSSYLHFIKTVLEHQMSYDILAL